MTTTPPIPTAMINSKMTTGWQSCMDLTCEVSPIAASANVVRSWNGTALNLSPPEFQMYRVVLSSDGDLLPPALFHLWPGTRFDLVPGEYFAGTVTRPIHDSVTILGRSFWRPTLDMFVTEPWRVSMNEHTKQVSWSLTAEEYMVPEGY